MVNQKAKNLRYRLIPFRDIDDQRTLQSDFLRAFKVKTKNHMGQSIQEWTN